MILIITHKEDYTSDFLINKLNQLKINYKRFNCEDILKYEVTISPDFGYKILGESNFKSVWYRRIKLPQLNFTDKKEHIFVLNEIDAFIKNLFLMIDAKWLSDPFRINQAENKLFQLKLAAEIGFLLPNTLVTNNKLELFDFYFKNNKDIILKPLYQSKIYDEKSTYFIFTNQLREDHILNLDDYDLTPCIYQNRIEKDYEVRVTVVGNKIFSARVNSQDDEQTKLDWRKKKLKFQQTEIPKSIELKCIELVKRLELKFGAIDLIKDKNDNFVFLEINPNGQWAWIEMDTGLQISDAIIGELTTQE